VYTERYREFESLTLRPEFYSDACPAGAPLCGAAGSRYAGESVYTERYREFESLSPHNLFTPM
jgi:hypothetical protein